MGPKSEAFCRQTLRVLEQNPQIAPSSVALAETGVDLVAREQLRPRMVRLARLSERASDTDVALGSDVMTVALQGYSLLTIAGRAECLHPLRQELGARFSKTSRRASQPTPAPLPETRAAYRLVFPRDSSEAAAMRLFSWPLQRVPACAPPKAASHQEIAGAALLDDADWFPRDAAHVALEPCARTS